MAQIGPMLANLVFKIRFSRKAIPDAFQTFGRDLVAQATDQRFKKWVPIAGLLGANLDLLAALSGTDKYGLHFYTPIYAALADPHRRKPVTLLELGVGGYAGGHGGESLRMWEAYFRKGRIYGIDIHDKTAFSKGRVKIFQCSQVDRERLTALCRDIGPFDFIIDDGSHMNAHQIESFHILWPYVKDAGVYVIEDVQTSYWPAFGGGVLGSRVYQRSCMSYFKSLVDSVNRCEFLTPPETETDRTIGSIAFHHNMIVLTKDKSLRTSNVPLEVDAVRANLMQPSDGADR